MPPLSRSPASLRLRVAFSFLHPPAHGAQRRKGAETRRRLGSAKGDGPGSGSASGLRPALKSLGDPVQDRSPALRRIAPPNPSSVSSVSLWCIPSVPASAGGGIREARRRLQAPVAERRAGENEPQSHRGHGGKDRCRLFLVPPRRCASALHSSFSTHQPMERRGAKARRRLGSAKDDGPAPRPACQDKTESSSCPPWVSRRLCPRPYPGAGPVDMQAVSATIRACR